VRILKSLRVRVGVGVTVRMKDKTFGEVVAERFIESWQDLAKLRKPVIAAVNGYAVWRWFFLDGMTECSLAGDASWL
jgi:enoyl-CoA hydratase/carnithine racemase